MKICIVSCWLAMGIVCLFISSLESLSKIYYIHLETISNGGLQNLGLCLAFIAFEHGGIIIVVTLGLGFFALVQSHRKGWMTTYFKHGSSLEDWYLFYYTPPTPRNKLRGVYSDPYVRPFVHPSDPISNQLLHLDRWTENHETFRNCSLHDAILHVLF